MKTEKLVARRNQRHIKISLKKKKIFFLFPQETNFSLF